MKTETITLNVEDMSGQRQYVARNVPTDASWSETMNGIVAGMSLPQNTPTGEGVWSGRLEREGRHLHGSEIVGDALQDGDQIVLQPEAIAGSPVA
jgi:hypothetical protein